METVTRRAALENALRAVGRDAVDVRIRDERSCRKPQVCCGPCRVVDGTESRRHVGIGVMPGGTAQRVNLQSSPSSHQLRRRHLPRTLPRRRRPGCPVPPPPIDTPIIRVQPSLPTMLVG